MSFYDFCNHFLFELHVTSTYFLVGSSQAFLVPKISWHSWQTACWASIICCALTHWTWYETLGHWINGANIEKLKLVLVIWLKNISFTLGHNHHYHYPRQQSLNSDMITTQSTVALPNGQFALSIQMDSLCVGWINSWEYKQQPYSFCTFIMMLKGGLKGIVSVTDLTTCSVDWIAFWCDYVSEYSIYIYMHCNHFQLESMGLINSEFRNIYIYI